MRRAMALAILAQLSASAPAFAKISKEQAARLVGVALVADWVVGTCGADGLDEMLVLTTPHVLKQLDPPALALGRKRVADRAARYPSKAAACADMKAGLIAIQ